jgi:hypothetical protein
MTLNDDQESHLCNKKIKKNKKKKNKKKNQKINRMRKKS